MLSRAYKATSHIAVWLIWHAARVSLLDDLNAPRRPD
jgi:hypothetical protein